MKAIKIASGVAVSALALAISAQANAAAHEGGDTEFSMSATGSMEAMFLMDLVAETKDVDLDEGDDFDTATAGEAWGLQLDTKVVHGPFSGTVRIVANDDSTANENGSTATSGVAVEVNDLIVTDGPISFGQVGKLNDTEDYAYDMGDSTTTGHDGAPVGAGIRYTMDGLAIQADGVNDTTAQGYETDYGVSAQYKGEADAISYVVEGQIRGSDEAPDGSDAYTYLGAGVTYTSDLFTAKAAVNQYGQDPKVTEFGYELSTSPIEALSLYTKGVNWDVSEELAVDNAKYLFGATYSIAPLTFKGEYLLTPADGGDEALFNVSYSQDQIGAYGEVTLKDLDTDMQSPVLEAGVNYTQENGVKYAADWDFQAEGDFNTEMHTMKLSAAYAF